MSINIGDKPEFNVVNVGDEITTDQLAAIQNSVGASGVNPFVTASSISVPNASTTVPGIVELATTAEAVAGTATNLAMTPDLVRSVRFINNTSEVDLTPLAWLTAFATWTGTRNRLNFPILGTTAAGSGLYRMDNEHSFLGANTTNVDFSKRIVLAGRFRLSQTSPTSNNIFRFTIGKSTSTTGDLNDRGVGVRLLYGSPLQLHVHNGTTLTNVTSTFTPSLDPMQTFSVRVESDGSGNVNLFANNVLVATTSLGPASASTGGGKNNVIFELESATTNTNAPSAYMGVCKVNYGTV